MHREVHTYRDGGEKEREERERDSIKILNENHST